MLKHIVATICIQHHSRSLYFVAALLEEGWPIEVEGKEKEYTEEGAPVFFDVLGLVVVSASASTALALAAVLLLLVALLLRRSAIEARQHRK